MVALRNQNRCLRALAWTLALVCTHDVFMCESFQLSMVSSGLPTPGRGLERSFGRRKSSGGATLPSFLPPPPPIPSMFDISAGLISKLAVVALKMRLADQQDVSCDVTASSSDLLIYGRVGPVTVKGKGWRSSLGLSCRAIDATVETCDLDTGKILTDRKLRLTVPATGKAMIALDANDFSNFITHPFMTPPKIENESPESSQIKFLKEDTRIDPKDGSVTFFSTYGGSTFKCVLTRGRDDDRKAVVTVTRMGVNEPMNGDAGAEARLGDALTSFFNDMVFQLDGTFLSFRDMMVTDKGSSPCVMLSLDILVKKFPSKGLEF